jgi:Cu-Zn family superoxide dismutase
MKLWVALLVAGVGVGLDAFAETGVVTDVDYATRSIRVGDDEDTGRYTIDANTVIRAGDERITPSELAIGDRVEISAVRETVGLDWPVARTIEVVQRAAESGDAGGLLHASMRDARNREIGTVTFRDAPDGVLIDADLRDLPPGAHGFHVHERGVCDPPFESAGVHLGSAASAHGFLGVRGPHAGDLPNLLVADDGRVSIELFARGLRFADLRDRDGSAVVVHARPDDHRSQPAGDAGDRIACGVIGAAPIAKPL